ncbi:hypothetical protein NITGR_280098 [Nitrospina gracilis 3/211]|uniref:Uncharacterized protein n=1 Tax=Nitrospina gracilis (strain 3/211) TaxID=1266370 RepID=M1YY09_NITG3|nr:hypothetical protein NITGR_280098 [Nitrospina gracilis 3/211]
MMSYVWIIDSSLAPHLRGTTGISPSYVIPRALVPEKPEDLAGARLWIVLRAARGDSLFGKVYVDLVEIFEDGMNAGDFCLTVDLSKSLACSRKLNIPVHSFKTPFTGGFKEGLHKAEEEIDERLTEVLERNLTVRLQGFPNKLFNKAKVFPLKGDASCKAHALIAATTATFCLDELWGSGSKTRIPPFANFAYQWLTKHHDNEATPEMRKALSDADPTTNHANKNRPPIKTIARKEPFPLSISSSCQ